VNDIIKLKMIKKMIVENIIPLFNSHTVGLSLKVHKLSFKINSAKEKMNGIYI